MVMARPKKVTAPLNEAVRARLRGDCEAKTSTNYASSGSEHDPNSAGFAEMVYGFMEEGDDEQEANNNKIGNCGRFRCNCLNGTGEPCSEESDGAPDSNDTDLKDILEGLVLDSNLVESLLHKEALRAIEMFEANQNRGEWYKNHENGDQMIQKSRMRRYVMKHLRVLGYNAGICKSRWEHSGGFPARDYEYIDVIVDGRERLFLDIEFQGEFEIARPTSQYHALMRILPEIFVGKAERLKRIIKIMCISAKRSLKNKEMHLPPWRRYRYMEGKWLGSYKRTTNAVPTWSVGNQNERLTTELESIAVKGSGWDYKKTMREAFKSKKKVVTSLQMEPVGGEMCRGWIPPSVNPRRVSEGRDAKVSGLAYALKESALSRLQRSKKR